MHVSALAASAAADLGGIATHLTLDLEGDAVTFNGTLEIGTGKVLTLTGGDDGDVFDVLTLEGSVSARDHLGGTAPAQVLAAIGRARERIA